MTDALRFYLRVDLRRIIWLRYGKLRYASFNFTKAGGMFTIAGFRLGCDYLFSDGLYSSSFSMSLMIIHDLCSYVGFRTRINDFTIDGYFMQVSELVTL